ncbi:MAG: hypothetical protein RQ748_11380, partial [Elusimicrobiales bacterium]|nr:hypothetical protein [Elusimicrobiales bacterium]
MKAPRREIEADGPSLTPGKAASLLRSGAEVWAVFEGAAGARLTAARLAALPPALQRRICVSGTFDSAAAGSLLRSARLFRRVEVREVIFELDPRGNWEGGGLAHLRAALAEIRADFFRELRSGSFPWPQPSRLYGIDLAGGSFAPPGPAARAVRKELGFFAPIERKLRRLASGAEEGALEFFQPLNARVLRGETGGKVPALRRLAASGRKVPPSYVLSAETARSLFPASARSRPAARKPSGRELRFLAELRGLFPPGRRFMIRSSSPEEDGEEASFAGVYRSEAVDGPAGAPAAIRRCLASGRDAGAAAYRRFAVRGRGAAPGLALLFQPFVEAGLGGVAVFDGRGRAVMEI